MLSRKVKEKEEDLATKTRLFDSIIEEYKNKIENLISVNENAMIKIKELETKLRGFRESENCLEKENKSLESVRISFENQLKNLKENFEVEIKEKKKLEEKNKNLISSIKLLNNKIIQIYKEEEERKQSNKNLMDKINNFFSPLSVSSMSTSNLRIEDNNSNEKNLLI
jgi:DNA repair exonuclease SbcCD ATPase subunit